MLLCRFLKGQIERGYNFQGLSLLLSHCTSLFLSVSHRHSLSLCVSLSLKAIHIQHNNPYKHLFLFMSLSFTRRSSTHANVNTEIGLPWGSFTHHSFEQRGPSIFTSFCFCQSSWLQSKDTLLQAFTLLSPWTELPWLKKRSGCGHCPCFDCSEVFIFFNIFLLLCHAKKSKMIHSKFWPQTAFKLAD